MTISEWILANFSQDLPPLNQSLEIALIIVLIYAVYNLFFSAILTWFKK